MSASQVSRLFRSATNEAFKDYIIRRRVSYAQHLIFDGKHFRGGTV